ncbi:unnamed protein product [Coffea canephora]|uniref:DH200=94 genomic scaffold, scaffold_386 n=1 Tax=Coffea canephora TaxID=49390 RepID=A0A068VF81_COFCA|nr:unnamed protein product [Coffea canephora]
MDFEEFCAAAINVHHLEARESWEQIYSYMGLLREMDENTALLYMPRSPKVGLSPSVPVNVLLQDWIRHFDGKLSFLGFVRLLHGVPHEHFRRLETTNCSD